MSTHKCKLISREGQLAEAEDLARQAVRLADSTDFLQLRGFALVELAEVLERRGNVGDSRRSLDEALQLFERKGNVVSAEDTRRRLDGRVAASTGRPVQEGDDLT
jgi:hypothetical protein